ncbi:protein kinase domain protein, partial [Ichthyophthirius multifiliis]
MQGYYGINQIYQCDKVNFLGGYSICGKNCIITNSFKYTNPLYSYTVKFRYVLIDLWNKNEFLIISINGKEAFRVQKTYSNRNICGLRSGELFLKAVFDFKTNDQNIIMTITNNLDQMPNNESLGIREFVIYANECMAECLECTDDVSCSKCKVGKYLYAGRCIDCNANCEQCTKKDVCDLCKSEYFYNDSQCVLECPNNKYLNIANKTCNNCDYKCATCSNATDCNTCNYNRLLPNCDCPQYSYDPKVFNLACTMCSTFSAGCSICNAIECLTCLTPYYFQLNSNGQCDSCLTIMTKMHISDDLLLLIIDFNYYYTNLQINLILTNLDFQSYSSQLQFTNQLCIETLDQAFISSKLQGNILCSFNKSQKTLTVQLDTTSTVNKNDIIKIKPGVFKLKNNGYDCSDFLQQITGKVILDSNPVIELTQTSPISICQQAQIRISNVSNTGNRKLKQITWTLVSSNVNTANEIAQINTFIQQQNNQLFLEIPPLKLKKQGQYQFQVQVVTQFNQSETANVMIQTLSNTSIDINANINPNQIFRSSLVHVGLNFNLLQCEDDGKKSYLQDNVYEVQIKQHDNLTEQLNIDSIQQIQGTQFQFQIQPFIMKANTTYNIQIIVSLKSDLKITQQILFPVQVLSSPPLVQILGGNRQQLFSQSFDIQAIVDDPNLSPTEKDILKATNYGINISWQCINISAGDDCKDSSNNLIVSPITQNLQISIQKNVLQPYQQYQFKISGTKDGLTEFDQITILMVDYSIPPVNPTISINNIQNTINLNQEIFTQFDCQEDTNVDDLIITGVIIYQNQQVNIISINYNQFRFKIWEYFFDFQNQNQFELKFSVRNPNFITPTLISYSLNANIPPQDCIFDKTTGFEVRNMQDKQLFAINECIDTDQPLTYSFYFYKNQDDYNNELLNAQYVNRQLISDFSLNNKIETVLPFGASLFMAVIQDSKGGIRNITQQIIVSQYSQDSSSYYTFINNWFTQTQQNILNKNKIIQYNMIIYDIINHASVLSLQTEQFIQLYIDILNEIMNLQNYFQQQTDSFDYFVQTQITLNLIFSNFLNQMLTQIGFDKIEQFINNIAQIINYLLRVIKDIVISDTTQYEKSFQSVQIFILQAKIIQNIYQVDRQSFQHKQNSLLDKQYMQIMRTISQALHVFLISNDDPINVLNIISTQKTTYKVLKEKYLKLNSNSYYESINIEKNQENLQYYVNYLEYPSSVITYDDNFPYPNNHTFTINEKTITFEYNQQQIQFDIPLFNIYNLSEAIDNVGNYICIQNIQGKWISKDCVLLYYTNDQNRIQQFICQCKTQGKQTLVNDINEIFKVTRINDWYFYASVWTLVATTIIYLMLFLYLQKIDNNQEQKMQQSTIKRNQITEIIFNKDINDQERNQQLDNILKNHEQIIQIQNQNFIETPNLKISIFQNKYYLYQQNIFIFLIYQISYINKSIIFFIISICFFLYFQFNFQRLFIWILKKQRFLLEQQVIQCQDIAIKKNEHNTQSINKIGSLISSQLQTEILQGKIQKIMPLIIQSNTIENKSRLVDEKQQKADDQLITEDKIKKIITHKISKLNSQIYTTVGQQQNNQENGIQSPNYQDKIQDLENNQAKPQKNTLVKRKKHQASLIRLQSQQSQQINKNVKNDYKYEEKTNYSGNQVQKGTNIISQSQQQQRQKVQSNLFTKNSSILQINNKMSFYNQNVLQNFLKESRIVQVIIFHELIQILILFNQFLSRPYRITQQYVKYIILITVNSILFYDLKTVLIILANSLLLLSINLFIILVESIYKLNKRIFKYLIYLIFIFIVIICFYIICISIQNKFYNK